ncbi:YdcF family protein [Paenibacillus athensensis]|uniref:DUF218 domain-containing protein n=1 Tax=Paenibacillus athensensis TaxID=1967502 RepID=A0A4Y8Q9C5_9BACL|nr:ElyC/SanA/YdcF family protein [Paenibacillus athensensis]MCD1259006.1 YdcF family protein [Paenibacillus athensensis]
MKLRSHLRKGILFLWLAAGIGALTVWTVSSGISRGMAPYIVSAGQAPVADAILVLGAYVRPNGEPSGMLADRLETALQLYEAGAAPKILVSGDHGRKEYDEVNTMREYLEQRGVPSASIFMDHAGFSTYESMYRARDIFQVREVTVVTQGYHLPRALFAARQLGLNAHGVAADLHRYGGMPRFEAREVVARAKDALYAGVLRPKPTFLGREIPITGDGRATHDR